MDKPVALVTGGSRGIGAAICERLAAEGYVVAVGYAQSKAKAETLARRIGGAAIQADVTDDEQVKSMFQHIKKNYKRLDILVTSAGIAILDGLDGLNRSDFTTTLDVNLWGTVHCVQLARQMMKQGSIVCLSSICARLPTPDALAYAASKAAVESFVGSTARTLAPAVRINAVAPGATLTDMAISAHGGRNELIKWAREKYLMGKVGKPEDIAAMVAFLCSDDAGHITGQTFTVDGGRSAG